MSVAKVNIYIDSVCKAKLQTISKKNHVSMSTIVAEMINYFGNMKTLYKPLQEKYFVDPTKATKTSIKPKYTLFDDSFLEKKNMYFSNLVYCFVYEKFEDYMLKELVLNQKHKFYRTLQKKKEQYYDYNTLTRNYVRMRKNKKFMSYVEGLNNATKRTKLSNETSYNTR